MIVYQKRVSDLDPSGADINWYKLSNPGVALNTTDLLVTGDYYARRQTGTCESDDSLKITVNVSNPSTPTTASVTQNFCQIAQKRVSDLDPSGADINWYKLSNPGVALNTTDLLVTGDYYARRQTGTCESDDSLKITVNVSNPSTPTTASLTQNFCQDCSKTSE
jgi:large repetitive protein